MGKVWMGKVHRLWRGVCREACSYSRLAVEASRSLSAMLAADRSAAGLFWSACASKKKWRACAHGQSSSSRSREGSEARLAAWRKAQPCAKGRGRSGHHIGGAGWCVWGERLPELIVAKGRGKGARGGTNRAGG